MWSFGTNRRHRAALLKPDIGVALVGEDRLEMLARERALWPLDHSDRPIEQGQRQSFGQLSPYSPTPVREAASKTGAAEVLTLLCVLGVSPDRQLRAKNALEVEDNRLRHDEICRPSSCER